MVLDVSMPGLTAWEVLNRIRELSDVPVLMLTARAEELGEGARPAGGRGRLRDEAVRPAGSSWRAWTRPCAAAASAPQAHETYADAFPDGRLRPAEGHRRRCRAGVDAARVPPARAFVRNQNQVLSHDQLLELAWGDARSADRDQVKLYVGYLRRKLGTGVGDESPDRNRPRLYRYRPLGSA